MKVLKPTQTKMSEESGLVALDIDPQKKYIISITGAGGKTSTLTSLALDYKNRGIPAIVTTTTHMFYPESKWTFTESEDLDTINRLLSQNGVLWIGKSVTPEKISGISFEGQKMLSNQPHTVIVEADGARRLPFKIPGDKEPVIFPKTNLIIGVLGLDALHRKIKEVSFRSELLADFLSKDEDELLTIEDFCKIIESPAGLYKGVTSEAEYKIILNKADRFELLEEALMIREKLSARFRKGLYITSHYQGGI